MSCREAVNGRWSQEGDYLLSGSDDHRLFIWSAYDKFAVRKVLETGSVSGDMLAYSGHTGNIFSAKFMPYTNNTKIISCAGDRLVKLSEVEYTPERQAPGSTKQTWYCHSDMTKRIVTEDNPNTFLSCSEDGTSRV
jgi:WD40 repeat protein